MANPKPKKPSNGQPAQRPAYFKSLTDDAVYPGDAAQISLDIAELKRMPNLDNATPESLVDDLGDVNELRKILEKREKLLKEAIKGRKGKGAVEGVRYGALISSETQERISSPLVRELLTPEQLGQVLTEISMTKITTTRKG